MPVAVTSCSVVAQNTKTIESVVAIDVPDAPILVGEFDNAGIKILITYSDGTTDLIPLTEDVCPAIYKKYFNEEGTFVVSFLYRGFEVSFEVTMYVADTWSVRFFNAFDDCVKEVVMSELTEGTPIPPTAEEMYCEGYIWTGEWDVDFEHATSDLDVHGIYEKTYTVDFFNGANTLISHQIVKEGEDAVAPTGNVIQMAGYDFLGWDVSYTNIQRDTVVYGLYSNVYAPHHLSVWDGTTASSYDGGLGTASDPYRIGSASQFARMANSNSSGQYFVLTCDMDMAGLPWTPKGLYASRIEGAGHTISNITINNSSGYRFGLFSENGSGSTIQNLNIKGISISINNTSASAYYVGGIIGSNGNGSTIDIKNVTVTGKITISTAGPAYVGGAAGIYGRAVSSNYYGNADNILTDVDISATHVGENSDAIYVGGVFGNSWSAKGVKNCLATGDIAVTGFTTYDLKRVGDYSTSSSRASNFSGYYYNSDQSYIAGSENFSDSSLATGVTMDTLNTASFYTDTMGLDAEKWNLENLDIQKKNIARIKVFNPLRS